MFRVNRQEGLRTCRFLFKSDTNFIGKRTFLQSCTKLIGFRLLVLTQFFSNCLYLFAEEVFLLILFYLLLDTRLNAFAELCELLLACNNVQKRYAARGTVLLFKKTLPILVFFKVMFASLNIYAVSSELFSITSNASERLFTPISSR